MSAASTAAVRPQPIFARLAAAMASRPLTISLVLTALITAVRLIDTVDSDVAWQLWIAGRMHAGAQLYRDIIEVNPPLWFWMALPLDRVANFLQVRIDAVLVVAMGGLVAPSLAATDRLLSNVDPARRTLLLGYAALAMAAMPWMHVGQREQIVLIATVPYAALIAARSEKRRVPALLAVLIGIGAGLGFALKHYFLIVPMLLEMWLIAGERRSWRPLRPETIAIALVGLGYAAAIVLFAPDYLKTILPLIQLAYGATGAPGLRYLFGPFALTGLVILGLCAGEYRQLVRVPFAATLVVAALGFAAAYFVQAKGWAYHAIPMLGCTSLALAILLGDGRLPRLLSIGAPALLAFPFFLALDDELHPTLPSPDLRAAVSGLKSGDTVGFLTTEPAFPWSVTLQGGYRYPSRYIGYWMVNAIIRNETLGGPNERLTALGRQVVTETVDDFRCAPPRRIIVWRPRPGENGFDILPFFLRDPDFARLLSHYRLRSRMTFETYEIASPLGPINRAACRPGI